MGLFFKTRWHRFRNPLFGAFFSTHAGIVLGILFFGLYSKHAGIVSGILFLAFFKTRWHRTRNPLFGFFQNTLASHQESSFWLFSKHAGIVSGILFFGLFSKHAGIAPLNSTRDTLDYKGLPYRCAKFRMPKTRMIPYSSAFNNLQPHLPKKHIGYARDRCMSDFIIIQ